MVQMQSALLGCLLMSAQASAAELRVIELDKAARVGQVCEFRLAGLSPVADPFNPDAAALDAEFTAPSGRRLRLPGFHVVPHGPVTVPPPRRIARRMRIFISTHRVREGHEIELLLDDMQLVDRDTGEAVRLDDFEREQPWKEQRTRVAVHTERPRSGKRALRMALTVPKRRGWPGMGRDLGDADWQRFEELRFWVCPVKGLEGISAGIEFYTPEGQKVQKPFDLTGAARGKWHEVVWRFPSLAETVRLDPAGPAEWRVRFTPGEPGTHQARFVYRGPEGEQTAVVRVQVSQGEFDGFARVSPRDPRYLEFGSGKPCFLVGMNLLGRELGHYHHYLDRLAQARCNFIRIWLSPRTLGYELKPGQYAQDRCAQFDALLAMCRERGIYVMACLTDFREVCSFHAHGYWQRAAYSAQAGGPCAKAEDFFTDPRAQRQYQRKLRYSVARWSAHPNLLCWEFFNEVNITDGWRKVPDQVRAWHRTMGAFLRRIEPYGRPITSSFAGIEDDALWEQPTMDIAQRHFYLRPGLNFVETAASAHAALARHGKPALIGEFGRARNRFAEVDRAGVSLHNGLWASVMSAGCGTAMTWWWRWVDEYGLWRHYKHLGRFIDGIDWPSERFTALQADVHCQPDPQVGFGAVRAAPRNASFKPAPFNQPVTVTLGPDGELDKPELLAKHLQGTRNHPDLHNPTTFQVHYERPGEFAVLVSGVSRHGGAGLVITVDGQARLTKDFPNTKADTTTIVRYDGRYAVPVSAGRHSITAENPGKDWFIVAAYEFTGALSKPRLSLLGLRGKRTVIAWLWNETHVWYSPILKLPRAILPQASATLKDVPHGSWRVRPYDPWTGEWGKPDEAKVGADGRLKLSVERLARDVAWRLERAE